jgi:hypothetical protein
MEPTKFQYAPPVSQPKRRASLFYFWGTYIGGAVIGLPLVGETSWAGLSGRPPDLGGTQLLCIGVAITTVVVALLQLFGWRIVRPSSDGAAAAAGFIVGMLSSLAGIAVAIVFFP